jgi:hypothetical protein
MPRGSGVDAVFSNDGKRGVFLLLTGIEGHRRVVKVHQARAVETRPLPDFTGTQPQSGIRAFVLVRLAFQDGRSIVDGGLDEDNSPAGARELLYELLPVFLVVGQRNVLPVLRFSFEIQKIPLLGAAVL